MGNWRNLSMVLVLFILMGFYPPSAFADEDVRVVPSADYFFDHDDAYSLSEVVALSESHWTGLGVEPISFGYDTTPIWFRVEIPAGEGRRLLQIEYPLLDHVHVAFFTDGEVVSEYHVGDQQPFTERPVLANSFVVPVPNAEEHLAFIRVQTSSSVRVPLYIWQESDFHAAQGPLNVAVGLYFGVLICMVVYNLFGYVVTREPSFFSYSIYVIFTGLLMAALSGVGFRYLWPEFLWMQERAIVLFGGLAFVFASIFITQLMNLRSHGLNWHRGLVALGIGAGIIAICSVLLPYAVTIRMLLGFAIIACSYVMVLGAAMWIRGMMHAQIFMLAWITFLASILFNSLAYLGILDGQFIQRYAIMIGSGIEVLLLSWVVTLMYSAERTQKIAAQDEALKQAFVAQEAQRQLNEELEVRVAERTKALEDVTARLQIANSELEQKSREDGLTRVFNRRYFNEQLQHVFTQSQDEGQPLSIVMVDIDHFKPLNDAYGHLIGDDILIDFAKRLEETASRPTDFVCRYGGEEFAVVLPDTDADAAERVAERLQDAIRKRPFSSKAGPLQVTASFGVATATVERPAQSALVLLKAADDALYRAKSKGRDQVIRVTVNADA